MRSPALRTWLDDDEIVADLFAGGGGTSKGIEAALGRSPDIALNHDPVAIAVHKANHPDTRHFLCDVWEVQPRRAVPPGRRVGLLWASPDCRHFSNAKGDVPRSKKVRALAWVVCRWAEEVRPRVIVVENVREFLSWGPLRADGRPNKARRGSTFRKWVRRLEGAGYKVEWRLLDASEYGAPTRRRRLFVIARADGRSIRWPDPTHGEGRAPYRTAAECIDWSLPCPSIFTRKRPLAEKTLWRIAQGIRRFVLDTSRPFIIKANHGRREFRGQHLDAPLSTITAQRRGHALVAPTLVQTGYGERPGQRPRFLNLHQPLGTVVGCGQKHALVASFLAKHFGDPLRSDGGGGVVVGSELTRPLGTITTRDHHSLAAVCLAQFRGTTNGGPGCAPVDAPLPTISAGGGRGGIHVAEVRAFLTAYYGTGTSHGQSLNQPLRTVTAKDRLGLVQVAGVDYQIVDIGFRMLEPEELLRAQCGDHAEGYDLSPARTKKDRVRLIGNMVCPDVAEQVVGANLRRSDEMAA